MSRATHTGSLDRRVTVQRATRVTNSFGELIETWSTLVTLWASVVDTSAHESYRAAEVGAELSARFTMRYSRATADIDERDRIIWGGKTYNITGVRRTRVRGSFVEIDAVARSDKT